MGCGVTVLGTPSVRAGTPRATQLIHVDPAGHTRRGGIDLEFPNGTVITPDGSTLIVGESMGGRYTAYDIEADGESLSVTRVFRRVY